MVSNTLQIAGIITIGLRIIAILALCYVAFLQYRQFKYPGDAFDGEGRLKWLLFCAVLLIAASNIPIGYLSFLRAQGHFASPLVTAWATLSNAVAMLLVALVFIVIYKND